MKGAYLLPSSSTLSFCSFRVGSAVSAGAARHHFLPQVFYVFSSGLIADGTLETPFLAG